MSNARQLYPHQELVFDAIRQGQNVILQAPTGSGKTFAALYPFLYSAGHREGFLPPNCIYSPPMRILVKQFFAEYMQTVKSLNLRYGLSLSVKAQTGDEPNDPTLSANLIFATIDQTLSSYLVSPYGLSRRKANLNAAAVMGAYLVFDEFHLFDPNSTLPTTLHLLRDLNEIAPFILMTATFSDQMLDDLGQWLNAKVISRHTVDFSQVASQRKIRRFHTIDTALTAEMVLKQHRSRSIVICNVVDRARALYQDLHHQRPSDIDEIFLLHSRFLPQDRALTEERIQASFGKARDKHGSYIIVATQAIEVGVDITCETLHTELAPANAVIQRAGRCARYQGDEGDVLVYRYVTQQDELIDLCEASHTMPYKEQATLFPLTWQAIAERSGRVFDFDTEQAVISAVHNKTDTELLRRLKATRTAYSEQVQGVQSGHTQADARHLIREIFSQNVTIHAAPNDLLADPFAVPSFSLHPGTLQGYLAGWLEAYNTMDEAPEWAVKVLYEHDSEGDKEGFEDAAQANQSHYRWQAIRDKKDALGAKLIVVHPALATYHPQLGFLAKRGDYPEWQAPTPAPGPKATREGYHLHLETYSDHIRLVHQVFITLWPRLAWTATRLEQRYGWEVGSVYKAAEMAVLLHDVGKLSRGWQKWVQEYQAKIDEPVEAGQAYAHTNYDSQNATHQAAQKALGKRPWHAVEGAISTMPLFYSLFAGTDHPLIKAAYSAIARHHAPFSDENMEFQLIPDAAQHIYAVADWLPPHPEPAYLQERITAYEGKTHYSASMIASPSQDRAAYHAYWLMVRLLRLADGEGTRLGTLGEL
jgi:CRISPR-associated endonuclease/helicase Cas3